MQKEQKLRMINEIKRIEREIYLKRNELAAAKTMEQEAGVREGLDTEEWKRISSRWIELMGQFSTGGNSVEDIRREGRRRSL